MSMGLATIGLDRFVGLAQWRNLPPGKVVTRPLVVPHPHLAINLEYIEHKPLRVAVTTPDGSVIPGYSLEESQIDVELEQIYSWAR